jgi:hypothetical protein
MSNVCGQKLAVYWRRPILLQWVACLSSLLSLATKLFLCGKPLQQTLQQLRRAWVFDHDPLPHPDTADDHLIDFDAHYSAQLPGESDDVEYSDTQYTDTINYDLSPQPQPPSGPASPPAPFRTPLPDVHANPVSNPYCCVDGITTITNRTHRQDNLHPTPVLTWHVSSFPSIPCPVPSFSFFTSYTHALCL